MLPYLKLFWYYKLAYYKYVFGVTGKSTAYNVAIRTNFRPESFSFPGKTKADWLISLRIFKKVLSAQFKKQKVNKSQGQTVAIFDCTITNAEKRKAYVQRLSGDKVKLVIGRSEVLNGVSFILSFFTFLSLLISFPFIFLVSLFSRNKLHLPLLTLNLVEALNLLFLLRKHEIRKLHFFCIYENDSNLLAHVLMKCGIEINKIPSEVPLQFWNKYVVADTLSLCFHYQEEEFNAFRNGMYVKEILNWIPENSIELEPIYKNTAYHTQKNTIGFYSSAMWLRQKKGQLDLSAADNEKKLLELLLEFSESDPDLKLLIFLHPMEKREISVTQQYYSGLSNRIEFADITKPNSHQFYKADVVVTLFSTLSYERLFWGYKTIVYPLGIKNFPITASAFANVCAKSREELFTKLKDALSVDQENFFRKNELTNYRYSEYPSFN